MQVRSVMTQRVVSCHTDSTLAVAASRMWLGDCGALPVLDQDGRVVGMVTDRDICFALAWKQRPASEIAVGELIEGKKLYSCAAETDVHDALKLMRDKHVRRLPVVDGEGKVVGILSITDAVLHAVLPGAAGHDELPQAEVVGTLQSVCKPPVRVVDEAELHA